MSFRLIKPSVTLNQEHTLWRPSMYRACIIGNKAEYDACEAKLMAIYRKLNGESDE